MSEPVYEALPGRQGPVRVLFVCGKNKWRSPTAERLYRHDPRLEVRSAGMSASSRHPITARDLSWAELVLVMEPGYGKRIHDQFRGLPLPVVADLDIPDEYEYMDEELIDLIRAGVESQLAAFVRRA